MLKSGMMNDKENRDEMEEMLRQGERLKLKQAGKNDNESSDDDRDLSDLEKDNKVDPSDDEDDSNGRQKIGKGVMNMEFMKNAEKREKSQNLKEIEELKRYQQGDANQIDKDLFGKVDGSANVNINQGRRIYTPANAESAKKANKLNKKVLNEVEIDESKSLGNRLKAQVDKNGKKNKKTSGNDSNSQQKQQEEEVNPWLQEPDSEDDDEHSRGQGSRKVRVVDESSSKLDKSAAKIAKKQQNKKRKHGQSEQNQDNDTKVQIETSKTTISIIDPLSKPTSDEYEGDATQQSDIQMFKQQDLIKLAFAGDSEVVIDEEFQAEKNAIEDEEDDKVVDDTLPGWGSWSSNPTSKKRKIIKTIKGVTRRDKRKDKNKKQVIINERVNKKNVKYMASSVPYPFETREQYEKSLRMPLGQEWVSKETHQKSVMPKVVVQFGDVVNPLKEFHKS
ncbi:unnamed protein product [Ambrosiozyma monospora]|uniref:Unnamed protein product n=1 Tax=Ambrosiozyma monospora TaxID=43982 RepID=A0ACB5TAN2_AMBMO|nr:unnamed protein product [Ambrosiozyma monospora]